MKLYHYTTLEALLGILGEESICFWGTRYDSMNDPQDYIFAKNIIIPKALNWCNENSSIEEIEEEVDYSEINPYIVSFSEYGDNLNLWRLYHGEVCLVLDRDILEAECTRQNLQFSKCVYSTVGDADLTDAIEQVFRRINLISAGYIDSLMECCVFIKNKDYKTEGEWRVYESDFGGFIGSPSSDSNSNEGLLKKIEEFPDNIKVKCIRDNDIILYKEFTFSKDIVKGIIIQEQDEKAFKKLKKHLELILISRRYDMLAKNIIKTQTIFRK